MAGFKSAFAAARKAGKKAFEWNGKSYNTKLAEDKPAPKPTARPMKEASASGAKADSSGTGSSASGKGKVPSKMKQAVRISTDKPKSFAERNKEAAANKSPSKAKTRAGKSY